MALYNEIDDLDLPYDPLSDAPNLYELTSGYSQASVDPFLSQVQPYNYYKEDLALERANLDRSVIENRMASDRYKAYMALDSMGGKKGKMGFASSGMYDMLDMSIEDSIASLSEAAYGDLRKTKLSAKEAVMSEREKYSESLWDLYSDFLMSSPEEGTPFTQTTGCDDIPGAYMHGGVCYYPNDEGGYDSTIDFGTVGGG